METVKNTTIESNPITNKATSAFHVNNHTSQPSEDKFRAYNKSTAFLPLYVTPNTNFTNFFLNEVTDYPHKPGLRYRGICHSTFKFCQRACRDAYRETCKDFECEKNFRTEMKKQCDVFCDKELDDAPVP